MCTSPAGSADSLDVPLDPTADRAVHDVRFWTRYLVPDAPTPDHVLPDVTLRFPFDDGDAAAALELDVDGESGDAYLSVVTDAAPEPVTVALDDEAHPLPHLFDAAEVDLLCRALALRDATLRHPGPVTALLSRFVVVLRGDDPEFLAPLVAAALAAPTGDGPDSEVWRPSVRDWFEPRDRRRGGDRWTTTPAGHRALDPSPEWTVPPVHSMRVESPAGFPFAALTQVLTAAHTCVDTARRAALEVLPGLDDLLDACWRAATAAEVTQRAGRLAAELRAAGHDGPTVQRGLTDPVDPTEVHWVLETLAAVPRGGLDRRWLHPTGIGSATVERLEISVVPDALPAGVTVQSLVDALTDRLRRAGLGAAQVSGVRLPSVQIALRIRDDPAAGRSVLNAVFADAGASYDEEAPPL